MIKVIMQQLQQRIMSFTQQHRTVNREANMTVDYGLLKNKTSGYNKGIRKY